MNQTNKQTVFSNLIWRFLERVGAQLVSFVVSMIIARILDPSAYGTIALMTVFIAVMQVFVDSGLGNALIQSKDADQESFSSVFYFNILFGLLMYVILFVSAPFIAHFYENDEMTTMLRVLGLVLIIASLKNVQQAYVSKHMIFKKFFFATLGGTIVAGILGIVAALNGAGAWALIIQFMVNGIIDTVILWLTVPWRPTWEFSMTKLKSLLSFGWKLLVSALLDTIYNKLRDLIIGKKYSESDLAFYNQGMKFPDLVVLNINASIDSVLLPTMAGIQDNTDGVKKMVEKSIKTSVYIMAPMMMGMAFIADTMIEVLLTQKWLESVFYLRIFCITYMFYPIHTANLNAIKAMGRSDLFLKLEIYKKIIGLFLLGVSMWYGVRAMAYTLLVSSVLSQIINSWPNKKLLNYTYLEQLRDIAPAILLSILMGVVIYPIKFLTLPLIMVLIIQILCGVLIYILLSWIFKLESFSFLLEIVKGYLKKRRTK